MKLGLPFSISIIFWFLVGIVRFFFEEIFSKPKKISKAKLEKKIKKAVFCIPAHNEEKVVVKSIRGLKKLVPVEQIYVVSDGSSDRTAQIARAERCNILELMPGRGKAKALVALIKHFRLLEKYEFITFVDADTVLDKSFLKRALKVFENDPKVAAISGYAISRWEKHKGLKKKMFFTSYRYRLYRLLQLFLVYGQTWRRTNVSFVVPGFACIYRTKVLRRLELDTPGILIEDFSMAFQIHKKRLGRIAHHPSIIGVAQDPDNFKDYWDQVKRWNVGFFQTVKRYGIWPSLFWLSTGVFALEAFANTIFFLLLPLLIALLITQYYPALVDPNIVKTAELVSSSYITLGQIFITVFLVDYFLTLLIAISDKKYKLALYGLGFLFFSHVNSLILMLSLPRGLFSQSQGIWSHPKRR